MSSDTFIEIKNLIKDYQVGEIEIRALNGVTPSIEEGLFVVILGPSGCGKTSS